MHAILGIILYAIGAASLHVPAAPPPPIAVQEAKAANETAEPVGLWAADALSRYTVTAPPPPTPKPFDLATLLIDIGFRVLDAAK